VSCIAYSINILAIALQSGKVRLYATNFALLNVAMYKVLLYLRGETPAEAFRTKRSEQFFKALLNVRPRSDLPMTSILLRQDHLADFSHSSRRSERSSSAAWAEPEQCTSDVRSIVVAMAHTIRAIQHQGG